MHITSHVEGRPHDDLHHKMGFGGFPMLYFLDANGKVQASPRQREVKSFEEALTHLQALQDLKRKIAAGEKGLEFDLFKTRYLLRKIKGDQAVAAAKAFTGLKAEQQAFVQQLLIDEEIGDLIGSSLGGRDALAKAGQRMMHILKSGHKPSAHVAANAYSIVARFGGQVGNAEALMMAAKGLSACFPNDEGMQRWAKRLKSDAEAMTEKKDK